MQQTIPASIAKEVWRLAVQIAMASTASSGDTKQGGGALPADLALQIFRQRLAALDRGLTARELDVCGRALIGLTSEGTALDLSIKKSSVLTYRKRAYAKLGISSQGQLFRLVA